MKAPSDVEPSNTAGRRAVSTRLCGQDREPRGDYRFFLVAVRHYLTDHNSIDLYIFCIILNYKVAVGRIGRINLIPYDVVLLPEQHNSVVLMMTSLSRA